MCAKTDLGDDTHPETVTRQERAASPETGVEREIGHDEYDPIGTAVLIVLYFLIIVSLWAFTYFVEFLGNDPTVVGTLGAVVVA